MVTSVVVGERVAWHKYGGCWLDVGCGCNGMHGWCRMLLCGYKLTGGVMGVGVCVCGCVDTGEWQQDTNMYLYIRTHARLILIH